MVAEKVDYSQYFTLKTITVDKVLEAIEKNGFKHLRESWLDFDANGNVIAGCVLGQAAVNLGILPVMPSYDAFEKHFPKVYSLDRKYEIKMNSWQSAIGESLPNGLVEFVIEHSLRNQLDRVGSPKELLGSQLIDYNDAYDYDDGIRKFTYSWKEVLMFARKILTPHLDKTVTLIEWTPRSLD